MHSNCRLNAVLDSCPKKSWRSGNSALQDEPAGIAEKRRRYLMTEMLRRDRNLVEQLRDFMRESVRFVRGHRVAPTALKFVKRIMSVG